jgi:hypothetical protein
LLRRIRIFLSIPGKPPDAASLKRLKIKSY